jgi:hypothetical protein
MTHLTTGEYRGGDIWYYVHSYKYVTMHLTSVSYIITRTMLARRQRVIHTRVCSYGEHSCTALARALLRRATSSSSALVLEVLMNQ